MRVSFWGQLTDGKDRLRTEHVIVGYPDLVVDPFIVDELGQLRGRQSEEAKDGNH